jgi:threonine dehydratase
MLTLTDIRGARQRIAGALYDSPCVHSAPLSEVAGCELFCKLDYLQRTGSFKERDARDALMLLTSEQREAGVIAASAGNHALELAYHGGLLGIPITVVMPVHAALVKVDTCRSLGAHVVLHGANFDDAREHALTLAEDRGLTYLSAFDNLNVIAGQGTIGLEILEQAPDIDGIVVPIGGAGLIAGIVTAFKALRPDVRVFGVESQNAASFTVALAAGQPRHIDVLPTLADGLAVSKVGAIGFEIAAPHIERVVTVSEDAIALAMLRLVEREKGMVEGAGAAPLAAFLEHKLPELHGQRVAIPLCGGNVDPNLLCRVIEKGLVADGRLCRFAASMSDRPGSLSEFTAIVAESGASPCRLCGRDTQYRACPCAIWAATCGGLCALQHVAPPNRLAMNQAPLEAGW